MWVYDENTKELVNLNEHVHNVYVKDYNYDSGKEYKVEFRNIIKGNGFSIKFPTKIERDNYFEHVINNLKPTSFNSNDKPITL